MREGLDRDTVLIQGEWHSDVVMSILEDEFRRLVHLWTWWSLARWECV